VHDDLNPIELGRIEKTTQELGRYLFARLSRSRPRVFERRWWDDRLMQWAMRDESVKVQMFRFIDVLPMLRSGDAITRHLRGYFHDVRSLLPAPARWGLAAARPGFAVGRLVARAARHNAEGAARRFIAGANLGEVLAVAHSERKLRRAFTLDLLGEAVVSDDEAQRYCRSYIDLIEGIAPVVNSWPEAPQIDRSLLAELPRVNVSVKLSALDSQFDAIDPQGATRRVADRLRTLLRVARTHRAHLHVDMESYATKDLTLAIFKQVLMEDEFRGATDVGIVIQCYLRDSWRDLESLRDWAEERGAPVWVRLVKGAYWDYETVRAIDLGWPIPVYQHKAETDANYERQTRFLMRNAHLLRPAIASHNLRSLAHAIAVAKHLGVPQTAFELQMLYGMADSEKQALVNEGYRLRIYMPFGQLIPGMAYLVRRLLENTSNDSFLRASFTEHTPVEKLLMNPLHHTHMTDGDQDDAVPAAAPRGPLAATFRNEPTADFAQADNRRAMQQALQSIGPRLGDTFPLWIGGHAVSTGQTLASINPSHKSVVVGRAAAATAQHADAAVAAAKLAGPAWSALGAAARGEFLRRAAGSMRRRRFELAAWEVVECGKGWREADADVCEAIDFCEYYALEAQRLESPRGADMPGEENRFEYWPRGVAAVIAPWNFPLAILTGMTAAALATGNTVVMKPAEQSPIIAALLMEIFREIGMPRGVLNYLPGDGDVVGRALVDHPDVAVIAFTGSRAVGLAINARAAEVSTRLTSVKRVIAEMGGKNAIIVDDDADLDEAVLGVMKSAFGYQGQKCSACSRAIVLESVHDAFVARLVAATRSLKVGPAEDPATSVGPLIDADALNRVKKYIAIGRETAREALAVDVGALADEGFYVGPHIFVEVAAESPLAQEEIFGPVLAVLRAKDFDTAIAMFNGTDYALTGGVFSRDPDNLARARRELVAGNLYLNRSITGALVGRQPFGGFKMSGIGSKAGGPDYLLQFVLPRTITENTMRRGFAPQPEAPAAESDVAKNLG
jgi:RHH-type proline utilization regulon transcriptional repressor/proline dehydrogenase/delta 1-pyrroline-5-carboxylate dehydrogenase